MNKPHILALDQKENAKHGETLFPMQKYITRLAADYPVVSMHWHEEAELTLITKGDCTYQIDFVTYEAKKGDILFVPPLLLHSISRRTSDEFFSETYVFHMNFLGGNTADICSTRYLIPLMNQELSLPCLITPEHSAYVSLRKIFRQITSLYNEAVIGYELALKSLFLQSIFLCCNTVPNVPRQKTVFPPTNSSKCLIILNFITQKQSQFPNLPSCAISATIILCAFLKNICI